MEDVSQRIQKAVESLVDDIDQSVSRPQQAGFLRTCNSCATHTDSPTSSPLTVISRMPRSYDPDHIPLSDPGLDCMACLQQAAYKCCYECFSDKSSKREWVQRCLEACQTKVQRTEAIIQGELIQFQERLQRCALRCQDQARSNFDPMRESSSADNSREMEMCVRACAEEQINSLPKMASRITHQAK